MLFLILLAIISVYFIVSSWKEAKRIEKLTANVPTSKRSLPIIGVTHTIFGGPEKLWELVYGYFQEAMKLGGRMKLYVGPQLCFGITDPEDVAEILKHHLEKPPFLYDFLKDLVGNGLILAEVEEWKVRRRYLQPAFSPNTINTYTDIFKKNIDKLIDKLNPHVGSGEFNIEPFINEFKFLTLCDVVFGDLQLTEEQKQLFFENVNTAFGLAAKRLSRFWLHPSWIYKFHPDYTLYNKTCEKVHNLVMEMIITKREINDSKGIQKNIPATIDKMQTYSSMPLADILLEKFTIPDKMIKEDMLVTLIAGTDTTSMAICGMLLFFGKFPHVQKRVYDETQSILGGADRTIVKEDLAHLPYFDRVWKETLRLHAAGSTFGRKMTKDVKLASGIILPKSSIAMISLYFMHRDPKYWGENADAFDPDRFLPERFNMEHQCNYMPFFVGARNCPGQYYALLVTKLCVANLIQKYEVVGEPEKTDVPNIKLKLNILLKTADGYKLALKRRTKLSD